MKTKATAKKTSRKPSRTGMNFPTAPKKASRLPGDPKHKASAKKAAAPAADNKKAQVIAMMSRPEGATAAEVMKATDWQAHTVRGFVAGTLKSKMGLKVESGKTEDGERYYKITSRPLAFLGGK